MSARALIPSSGPISISDIKTAFNSNSNNISSLRSTGVSYGLTSSGSISFSSFRNKGLLVFDDQTSPSPVGAYKTSDPTNSNGGASTSRQVVYSRYSYVELTQNVNSQSSIYYWNGILGYQWEVTADVYSGSSSYGADGIWFFAYRTFDTARTLPFGNNVYYTQYEGLDGPAYQYNAQEFDPYSSGKSTYEIHGPTRSTPIDRVGQASSTSDPQNQGFLITYIRVNENLDNGVWRTLKIVFDNKGTYNSMQFYSDNVLKLDVNHTPVVSVPYSTASYFGFGGKTGGLNTYHRIRNISIKRYR